MRGSGESGSMLYWTSLGSYVCELSRGLLEYHSSHERDYIESMREAEQLEVFRKHAAEGWYPTAQSIDISLTKTPSRQSGA